MNPIDFKGQSLLDQWMDKLNIFVSHDVVYDVLILW